MKDFGHPMARVWASLGGLCFVMTSCRTLAGWTAWAAMQWSLSLTPLPRKSTIPCPATGASAGPASRDTPRREWRSLEVTPNRRWGSRGHYPESPLHCDEDVAGTDPGP